jgi:hypothetical protein
MTYKCPKGHDSTDSDYCSECGALIGQSKIAAVEPIQVSTPNKPSGASQEICPDCGTPREGNARFCEVCRHDFQDNKTGVAEVIVASQQPQKPQEEIKEAAKPVDVPVKQPDVVPVKADEPVIAAITQKLNIVISVDSDRLSQWDGESPVKPDVRERVFPLDLDENLVGRRSQVKGVFPEIEINDPGVSHRHLKFIKQPDGSFSVLELGSSNGTEINGAVLEPGINTPVKDGDNLAIGIWTLLKIVGR